MGKKERSGSVSERSSDKSTGRGEERDHERKSKRKSRENSEEVEVDEEEAELERQSEKGEKIKRNSRRKYSNDSSSSSSGVSDSEASESESERSGEESESEEERRRRRRRRKKRRRREEEEERERRKRREKVKKRRRREKEEEKKKKEKKKKKKDKGTKGAVTNSWGKYGIIRETDMWNKRPEFTAWLMEVKQVNLEHLPNWEEKQMFKQFMEDHNTATFPSKKYYNLDAYYRSQLEKEIKKGSKKVVTKEMTVFNDEEQRRLELMRAREKKKEEEVESLKRSMQSGMAQSMKEQAQLREEMAFQYKLGNFEKAAAIQRRLDPDVPM